MADPFDSSIFGDQSVSDYLTLTETPELRNQYYRLLDDANQRMAEPPRMDQSQAFIQGILPALAVGLMTKGKGLQFAGEPLANVYKQQQDLATNQQKMDVDSKLKAAGLLSDTLEKRDKMAVDAETRRMTLQQRDEQAQERNDTLLAVAGMNAAGRADREDDRRRDRLDRYGHSDEEKYFTKWESYLKDVSSAGKRIKSLRSLLTASESNEDLAGPIDAATQALMAQINNDGGRPTDYEQRMSGLNSSLDSSVKKWKNWFDGGAQGTMPELQKDAAKLVADTLTGIYAEDVARKKEGFVSRINNNPYIDESRKKLVVDDMSKMVPSMFDTKPKERRFEVILDGEKKVMTQAEIDAYNASQGK